MSTMKEQTDIRDRSFIEVNRYDHREDVLNDLMNRLEDLQRKITNLTPNDVNPRPGPLRRSDTNESIVSRSSVSSGKAGGRSRSNSKSGRSPKPKIRNNTRNNVSDMDASAQTAYLLSLVTYFRMVIDQVQWTEETAEEFRRKGVSKANSLAAAVIRLPWLHKYSGSWPLEQKIVAKDMLSCGIDLFQRWIKKVVITKDLLDLWQETEVKIDIYLQKERKSELLGTASIPLSSLLVPPFCIQENAPIILGRHQMRGSLQMLMNFGSRWPAFSETLVSMGYEDEMDFESPRTGNMPAFRSSSISPASDDKITQTYNEWSTIRQNSSESQRNSLEFQRNFPEYEAKPGAIATQTDELNGSGLGAIQDRQSSSFASSSAADQLLEMLEKDALMEFRTSAELKRMKQRINIADRILHNGSAERSSNGLTEPDSGQCVGFCIENLLNIRWNHESAGHRIRLRFGCLGDDLNFTPHIDLIDVADNRGRVSIDFCFTLHVMKSKRKQIVVYAFADYSDAPVAMICFWPNDGNFESGIYELIPLDKNLALMGFVNFSIDVHSFCESCKIYQKISRTAAS